MMDWDRNDEKQESQISPCGCVAYRGHSTNNGYRAVFQYLERLGSPSLLAVPLDCRSNLSMASTSWSGKKQQI
jgi:hypothetical protein